MSRVLIEVACTNMVSVRAAIESGADRIELCAALGVGGITPSDGFIREALEKSSVPVFVMIRPREGDFLYSSEELEIMLKDVAMCRSAGVPGIVTGMLTKDGEIDKEKAKRIMEAAGDMSVTFHRAFDLSADAMQSLSDLVGLGFHRLLTSGMAASAPVGADCIRELVVKSDGKITVMAGAGVRPDNVASLVRSTGVREVHLSGKVMMKSGMSFRRDHLAMGTPDTDDYLLPVTDAAIIRALRKELDAL
ncbi:MAG: Copper homeostasis protein CutC [Bacteroidota bacterium]